MKLSAVLNLWILRAPAVGVNRDGTESIPSRRSMQASATCGPCQNGGQCLEQLADARVCTCLHGYTGINCDVDYAQCETVIRSKQNVTDTVALREYLSNSSVQVVSQRQELSDNAVHYVTCRAFIGLVTYTRACASGPASSCRAGWSSVLESDLCWRLLLLIHVLRVTVMTESKC